MKTCRNEDCTDPGQTVYSDDTQLCPRCGAEVPVVKELSAA